MKDDGIIDCRFQIDVDVWVLEGVSWEIMK